MTDLLHFWVLVSSVCIYLNFNRCNADIHVLKAMQHGGGFYEVNSFCDFPSTFGARIPSQGDLVYTVFAKPHNACLPIEPCPTLVASNDTVRRFFAVISRTDEGDNCPFVRKVYNAQKAGFAGAIIHNVGSEQLVYMKDDGGLGSEIKIPSVFVGEMDGIALGTEYSYQAKGPRYIIKVNSKVCFNTDFLKKYLLPFAITVGVCFLLMVSYMCVKGISNIRKTRRGRLSTRNLKKIPVKKFKKGDKYDMCAICLDEYDEGEKLRVLPCQHAYHVKCVDPWLTNNKRTCPVCKRKVIPGRDPEDTDSDEDNGNNTEDEHEPLLGAQIIIQQARRNINQSTFDRSGLPSALRSEVTQIGSPPSSYGATDTETASMDDTLLTYTPLSNSESSTDSTIYMPGYVAMPIENTTQTLVTSDEGRNNMMVEMKDTAQCLDRGSDNKQTDVVVVGGQSNSPREDLAKTI